VETPTAGTLYLTDIWDTLKPQQPVAAANFAHHVHLTWELPFATSDFPYATSPIWKALPFARLRFVDVTSATWSSATRQMVRSYSLHYTTNPTQTRSFLTSIRMTGDCLGTPSTHPGPVVENTFGVLDGTCTANCVGAQPDRPFTGSCAALPATTYTYSGIGSLGGAPRILRTLESFDLSACPVHPGQAQTGSTLPLPELADFNGDALADLACVEQDGSTARVEYGGGLGVATVSSNVDLNTFLLITSPTGYEVSLTSAVGALGTFGTWGATDRPGVLVLGPDVLPHLLAGTLSDPSASGNVTLVNTPLAADDLTYLQQLQPQIESSNLGIFAGHGFDVDGDGLVDVNLYAPAAESPTYQSLLTTQDRLGLVHPLRFASASFAWTIAYDPNFYGSVQLLGIPLPTRAFADLDGDGLKDLVMASKFCPYDGTTGQVTACNLLDLTTPRSVGLFIVANRGDGRFGGAGAGLSGGDGYGVSFFPIPTHATEQGTVLGALPFDPNATSFQSQPAVIRFGDLNSDGMEDYAVLDSNGLWICLRNGPTLATANWQCTQADSSFVFGTSFIGSQPSNDIEIADLDGTGIPYVVYLPRDGSGAPARALRVSQDGTPNDDGSVQPRDGLLESISNGVGGGTTLQYAPVSRLATAGGKLPVPAWVVTSMTSTNGLVGTPQGVSATTSYDYTTPYYDPRERTFAGFRDVIETRTGSPASAVTQVGTLFATDTCPGHGDCTSTTDTSYYHAMRGVPFFVETVDGMNGHHFTSVYNEWQLRPMYTGLDGRHVVNRFLNVQHTYLWDDNGTVADTGTLHNAFGDPRAFSVNVPLPAVQTMHTTLIDGLGNPTTSIDWGVFGVDPAVQTVVAWNRPPGDTTGWTSRPTAALVYPKGQAAVREYDYSYYPNGLLKTVSATLSGSLPLLGPSGTTASRPAPQPGDASHDGTVLLESLSYFGNGTIKQIVGANQRCTEVAYDNLFGQFPATVTRHAGSCGDAGLPTQYVFDRGLELRISTTTPAGRDALTVYDDFGRLTAFYQPDPVYFGSVLPAIYADYNDTGPVRRVHFQTGDGSEIQNNGPLVPPTTHPPSIFVDHYRYLDGLGDTLEAIDPIDPSGTGSLWAVSGMHTRLANGGVSDAYQPFPVTAAQFQSAPPGTLPLSAPPAGLAKRHFDYDALGRPVASTDYLANVATFTYHDAALSLDLRDPLQQHGAPRSQSLTTVVHDGFGRLKEVDQVRANVAQPGLVTMKASYQVTGEPTTITRSYQGASVTRTMQYDSLGRLVVNTEPNVGSWTYAYNNAGELVGTSDARGCGENLFHDGLGRLVAEDYSPCDATSQPTYSLADPTTGAGTETFNVYDADSLLVAQYDRAQESVYKYDGRGRVVGVQRRAALPVSTTSSNGGTGTGSAAISGTVVDALGNPKSGVTMTLAGSANGTQITDINGHYAFSVKESAGGTNYSYSVQPSLSGGGCTFVPGVANLNSLAASAVVDFTGSGPKCEGTAAIVPPPALGDVTISGSITAPDGTGLAGITVQLNGTEQGSTQTDASGLYGFTGLARGSYQVNPSGFLNCQFQPVNLNNISGNVVQNFVGPVSCETQRGTGVLPASGSLANRYAPHTFAKTFQYSAAGRVVAETTGADLPELTVNGSEVDTTYDPRGVARAVTSSYGSLVASTDVDASGAVTRQAFGDLAGTWATPAYDANRALVGYALQRQAGANGAWAKYAQNNPPKPNDFTVPTVLASLAIGRDAMQNPMSLAQSTSPQAAQGAVPPVTLPAIVPPEWSDGAKPIVSRSYGYDDNYRLSKADFTYAGENSSTVDSFASPYTPDEIDAGTYPALLAPLPADRPKDQTYSYDWRGNLTQSTDDSNAFGDRSLGAMTSGSPGSVGPDQLVSASFAAGAATITTLYDGAGNLKTIVDTATNTAYSYTWDEVGQLSSATRSDNSQVIVQEQYAYNAGGGRVRTTRTKHDGTVDHTLQVFGSLRLEQAAFPGAPGDYERDPRTEHVYLNAAGMLLGHVFYDEDGLPQATGQTPNNGNIHVFMPLGDPQGSTSFVIDHDTSELVEAISYQPYGGVESDYRPQRWQSFRENLRYTGHWDDSQVGLVYFGARYYSPLIARWISPDPLTIHGFAGDLNPYAFVGGSPTANVDALGLQAQDFPNGPAPDQPYSTQELVNSWQQKGWGQASDQSDEGDQGNEGSSQLVYDRSVSVGGAQGAGSNAAPDASALAASQAAQAGVGGPSAWQQLGQGALSALGTAVVATNPALFATVGFIRNVGTVADSSAPTWQRYLAGAGIALSFAPLVGRAIGALTSEGGAVARTLIDAEGLCAGGVCCFVKGTPVDTPSGSKPIEQIELGERVGPESEACHAVDFAGWREVHLTMRLDDHGVEDDLDIHLLRPVDWLRQHHVQAGGTVELRLDDLSPSGPPAVVTFVGPAPGSSSGARCPVTGTVRHVSSDVISVMLEGSDQPLEVSSHHRLFSADRQDWVPAGALEPGELLRTKDGTVRVKEVSQERLPRTTVFNLEVAGEHQYFVHETGVLAHNIYGEAATAAEELTATISEGHPTFQPGPFAGESIPAQSTAQTFTPAEREAMNEIMKETGCHTCGTPNPGTITGNAVPDHQPVSALNFGGAPQRLFPQCLGCSTEQGLAVARALRALKNSE
jgi:RHS repeat-associated protein